MVIKKKPCVISNNLGFFPMDVTQFCKTSRGNQHMRLLSLLTDFFCYINTRLANKILNNSQMSSSDFPLNRKTKRSIVPFEWFLISQARQLHSCSSTISIEIQNPISTAYHRLDSSLYLFVLAIIQLLVLPTGYINISRYYFLHLFRTLFSILPDKRFLS